MNYDSIILGLKTLSSRCDGANSLDGQGFSRFDTEIGHSLARQSNLSDRQAKIGQSLIIKYAGQLDPDLVSKVKSLEIVIHTPSIETALNTLNWSAPKIVKGGTLQLETANPTQVFWAVWKENKENLKSQGFSVTNDKGDWKVNKWTKIGVSAVATNSPLNNNETVAPVVPSTPVNIPEETRVKLLPHQPASVEKLVNSIKEYGAALDASDCGVGKTFISLACAKTLGMKALVICPKPAIPGWQRAAEYMGVEASVINYEMIKTGNTEWGTWVSSIVENSKGEKKKVETFEWTTLYETLMIWDECHKLKNRDTINSQIAIGARLQGNKMLLLSATAASNPLEMKALGFILNLFPLKGYWNWAERHGVRKGRFGMEFTGGAYHLQNIHKSIFHHSPVVRGVRLKRNDIPGFPETLIISEALDFDGENSKIQAAYNEMQDEIARLKERSDLDTNACILTEILRARQKIELLKIPTLAEKANDLVAEGMAVPIFLSFKESIRSLAEKLNTDCIIDGEHTGNIREENRLKFQRRDEKIIICSILAGESIDLDDQTGECPTDALLCPDFSAQRILQAIGRTHRAKTVSKSIQRFCYAAGTIEERARQRVMEKARNISLLTDGDLTCGLVI